MPVAPYELVERIRASINVLGPLLTRCGHVRLSLPGGDDFGSRPIDMHVAGLEAMGATFKFSHGYLEAFADRLHGADIIFDFPSVGATENLLTAAVLADGVTRIDNAAREPEIADLCEFLVAMGANISGIGTSTLVIEGVEQGSLRPARHHTVPDRIQAATYVAAVAVAGGALTIEGARPDHMAMLLERFADMALDITCVDGHMRVSAPDRLRSIDVATLPYPGIATDYKPLVITMLSVADGVGIVTENLYPGSVPLRRGAAAAGCRRPHEWPPRGGARCAATVGCAGAGARHPCRCGDGRRRPRRRGRNGDLRRAPHRSRLRRPRGSTAARRRVDRARSVLTPLIRCRLICGRLARGRSFRGVGGRVDPPFGERQQAGDQHDGPGHEEDLVPAALVGDDRGRGDHGIDRTAIAD